MEREKPVQMVLCTQNPALRTSFSAAVSHWAVEQCVDTVLQPAEMLPGQGPDVLFLDVDGAGFPAPERPQALARTAIIAISASPEWAIEACRWHTAAFLPPNAAPGRLRRAMNRCFSAWRGGLLWLTPPVRRGRVRLPLCQLRYAEASGHDTRLCCAGGWVEISMPIKNLAEALPSPPFFRCQKAFVVHLSGIAAFSAGQLVMKGDGRRISVSRRQVAPLRQALRQWREGENRCGSLL